MAVFLYSVTFSTGGMMKFFNAIGFGFKNYFNFSGEVGRSIFWLWFLFTALVELSLYFLGLILQTSLLWISLVFFIPSLALTIRRLRDAGKSPHFLWIWVLAPMGAVIGSLYGQSIVSTDGSSDGARLVEWFLDMLVAPWFLLAGGLTGMAIAFTVVTILLALQTKKP